MRRKTWRVLFAILAAVWVVAASQLHAEAAKKDFLFGMLLVGPYNDRGWSQAHYEAGKWEQNWLWLGPDWKNINDPDTSTVGFLPGPALSQSARASLEGFIMELASGRLRLFQGPLDYQDGPAFLKAGETATDKQIWYMKQLLKGMEGESKAK